MPFQTRPKGWRTLLAGCVLATQAAVHVSASEEVQVQPNRRILASADFTITGLAVKAEPTHQDLPRHTPSVIHTRLAGLEGEASAVLMQLDPDYRVRGQLIGPSVTSPLELECAIGTPLHVPALALPGDHLITNLRVVDTGLAGSPTVAEVIPDTCSLSVLDQLLVSQVQVRELTYEEILASGINVSQDSYSYYNFTLALGTESEGYKISIPVAMPHTVGDPPIAGPPQSYAQVGTTAPMPDVVALFLEPEEPGGGGGAELEGASIRIPGLIIFPGRIALLHQFFEAILIVSNGAPENTPLVVHTLSARLELPQAPSPLDNPLRVAELQVGGAVEELELHGLGLDGSYGTQDDTSRFAPGESGQASFLIEGLKEGLHTIKFKLKGTLEGLPAGPVQVRGEAVGAVRVRDGSFAVSFTHPGVVRVAQEYDLGLTLFNSGSRDILGAYADLSPLRIVGADLADPSQGNQRSFPAAIKPGESGTVTWRLRSRVTGKVTASFRKVEGATETCLELVTGVGDRNVPLSPDSLILPDAVRYLPPPVVEASSALLGHAWSNATAPSGTLPEGILPVSKQSVFDRAIELGIAGLRIRFGEPLQVSLVTLLRDWLGETQETPDPGFVETVGSTKTGFSWQDDLGEQLSLVLGSESTSAYHRAIAEGELARSRFLSVLLAHPEAPPFVGARLIDPEGHAVGLSGPQDRFGGVSAGSMLRLGTSVNGQAHSRGAFLLASSPAYGVWTLELTAWQSGWVDISILLPVDDDLYRQLSFSSVSLAAGGTYRVTFNPYLSSRAVVEQCAYGACSPFGGAAAVDLLQEPPPRLIGALQIGPAIMEAGDRFGRMAALLFSKPVSQQSAEDAANYSIGGGMLVGSNPPVTVGGPVRVAGAKLNFSNRFAFLKPSSPIGPFIQRTITLTGVNDTRGLSLSPPVTDVPIEMTVSPGGLPPGGYLTGRVINADGTPVAGAAIDLFDWPCGAVMPVWIAGVKSDSAGRYVFDYVVNGECSPLSATSTHSTTASQKQVSIPVVYQGQHLVVDFVFLARGRLQGEITLDGQPVGGAQVQIMSNSDPTVAQLVHADSTGKYLALDIPVGGVSVLAVGPEGQMNATGFGAGWIDGPGKTATVDVTLQSVSGSIKGKVVNADGQPVPRMLVIAESCIPGICIPGVTPPVTLGFRYTGSDGSFELSNLPLSIVRVYATDYASRLQVAQEIQLTSQVPSVAGVVLTLPGYGSVSGRVVDQAGYFLPMAEVRCGIAVVTADPFGYYRMPMVIAGTHDVVAVNPVTGLQGSTSVTVWAGQETTNANIVISAAATIKGTVSIVRTPGMPAVPLSGVKVTYDGFKIVSTNSQGAYVLPNVPPGGSFILRFVDPTGRLGVNQVVTLNPGETLIRNVTFHPATISGKVFQPDGQTGAVARIRIYVPRPILADGQFFGLLDAEAPITTVSEGDGTYLVSNLNPSGFRIAASNDFFPTPVGRVGVLLPDSLVICNLMLVDTLGGAIKGRIFQPDGVTPVGEGIQVTLGGGHLADAMVRTDADGFYSFPEVFASGIYHLTAADLVTGYSNRVRISVVQNQDAITDIRLLGRGAIRARVIDAAGSSVESGTVTVTGLDYPNATAQAGLTLGSDGAVLFEDLPEGQYSVTASRQGLSGRVSASVSLSCLVEVTVQLLPSGIVTGRVLMPDGATPVGLADVRLILDGRILGYTVTSDEGDAVGKFLFPDVPLGDFKLEAFDNRSTSVGRTAARLTQNGETVSADIVLGSIGTVRGQVTANNAPVDHAFVTLESGEFGFSQTRLHATTDAAGKYQFPGIPAGSFTLQVIHQASGMTGSAEGILHGGPEPLPDKIVNITLEQSASLEGVVLDQHGTPVTSAQVTVTIGSRTLTSTTRADGTFRLDYVPLGEAMVRAQAPAGYDRGKTGPVVVSQPGSTIPVEVRFDGVGTVQGDAFDGDGVTRLTLGTVRLTNTEWSPPVVLACPVEEGRYEIHGAPAGPFTLKLTVPDRTAVGVATATLAADQVLSIPLTLEPAGAVTGKVVRPDGTTPAVGADVMLRVTRAAGGTLTHTAHTDAAGVYRLDQVLLGMIEISVELYESDGLAGITGLSLSANGEVLQVPLLVLDENPIEVQSVSPANGSIGVSRSTVVTVTFTEPANGSTVNWNSFKLLNEGKQVLANLALSPDGLVATLTPVDILADSSTFTVVVTTQVADLVGRKLPAEFRSTFTTADETPPVVTAIDPPAGATQVVVEKVIQVTFNEALDPQQSFAGVVRVFPDGHPEALVPLVMSLSETGQILTAQPSVPLAESTRYRIEVTSQKDLAGNMQPSLYTSGFSTVDRTKPVLDSISVEGQTLFTKTPLIVMSYHDDFSGIDTASIVLRLNGLDIRNAASVYSDEARYQVPGSTPLERGLQILEVQVSDKVGNQSDLKTAEFWVDSVPPQITSFMIAGQPVFDDMTVTVFRPVFTATYSDNGEVNETATKLRLGLRNEPVAEVPASVSKTSLTYQPAANLAEGEYFVELIVSDVIGNSVTTGPIRMLLDVDAPEITVVAPLSGNQHGGTVITMEGSRLLQPNGSPPVVTVGGNPAYLLSAQAGAPDIVTIVTPPGVPGLTTIRVQTERGEGTVNGFFYETDNQTPFAVEDDTLLLWHLDEPLDGAATTADSAPLALEGSGSSASRAVQGRFGFGRSGMVTAAHDQGLLTVGSHSFTLECWVRTNEISRTYVLAGKPPGTWLGSYSLSLKPSGAVWGYLRDTGNHYWQAVTDPALDQVFDGQWHYVAMTVDRSTGLLKLYVDGVERASSTEPAGFGEVGNSSLFRIGTYDLSDGSPGPPDFPGTIDEVRLSVNAHSGARIFEMWLGRNGPQVLEAARLGPNRLRRGLREEIQVTGYNLAGVKAEVFDTSGEQLPSEVLASSATTARLQVELPSSAPFGEAELRLHSDRGDAVVRLPVFDPARNAAALEEDTLLLMHFDEPQGETNLLDSGPFSIDKAPAFPDPAAYQGFVGNARAALMDIESDLGLLDMTEESFTAECWIKIPSNARPSLYYVYYYDATWGLEITAAGGLQATVRDAKNNTVSAVVWPITLDPEKGRVVARNLDDGQWHHLAMVFDREAGLLSAYVDGKLRQSNPIPLTFGQLKKSGVYSRLQIRSPNAAALIDELRVSFRAHTEQRIWEDYSGDHTVRVGSIVPFGVHDRRILNRGISVPMTLNGFGLDGTTVRITRNEVDLEADISILESSYRRVKLELFLEPDVPLGPADLVLALPSGSEVAIPAEIIQNRAPRIESDTVLLWRLDEPGNSRVYIRDAAGVATGGQSGGYSTSVDGRFGEARRCAEVSSFDDGGLLEFASRSFTVEAWVKLPIRVNNDSALFGRGPSGLSGGSHLDWGLSFSQSGGLRAIFRDKQGAEWTVVMEPLNSGPDGLRKTVLGDNEWHYLGLVFDKEAGQVEIYVDGLKEMSAAVPAGFGPLRSQTGSTFQLGFLSGGFSDADLYGISDDTRVSLSAHTPSQIWQDFSGIGPPRVTAVSPALIQRNRTCTTLTEVRVAGYQLRQLAARLTRNQSPVAGVSIGLTQTSDTEAQILISVSPQVTLGAAELLLSVGGESFRQAVQIVEPTSLPLTSDTALLWHMENGQDGSVTLADSGRFRIVGVTHPTSTAESGRFGVGRKNAGIQLSVQGGPTEVGWSDFSIECWMKTGAIGRPYILAGKQYSGYRSYGLVLLPSGILRARAVDTSGTAWKTDVSPIEVGPDGASLVRPLLDDQWHLIGMVVDRRSGLMTVYVDGVQRGSAVAPIGFGEVSAQNYLYAGFQDLTETGHLYGGAGFPGIIDDVRFSTAAHSSTDMATAFFGTDAPQVTDTVPETVPRGSANFLISLHGTGLAGASVRAESSSILVETVGTSPLQADVRITLPAEFPAGPVVLEVQDPVGRVASAILTVTAPLPFANPSLTDGDTLILWHLDDDRPGQIGLQGSGDFVPDVINASSSPASLPVSDALFGYARKCASLTASSGFDMFEPATSSFTVECWVRTGPVDRAYNLVGRSDSEGANPEFGVALLASGTLRAFLYDSANLTWTAESQVVAYDPVAGVWTTCIVDDGQWHLISIVVDRVAGALRLFVDGEHKASVSAPSGFGNLRNNGKRFRAGYRNQTIWGGASGTPEFQGDLDEIRIVARAREAGEIRTDYGLSVTSPSLSLHPDLVGREAVPADNNARIRSEIFNNTDHVTTDALLLWHLDERANGAVTIVGADPACEAIGGRASPASIAEAGRFAGGRTSAGIVADPDDGAFDFGASSFSLEFWLRTDPVFATYTLAGRDGPLGEAKDFGVSMLPSGRLRAWLFDSAGLEWSAEPDISVDDSRWRLITMSVDREGGWLYLFVDEELVSSAPCPTGFRALGNQGQPFRAGHLDVHGPARFAAPPEFPGVLDEMRILDYARKPGEARQ